MSSAETPSDRPVLSHTRVAAAGRTPERWLLVLHGIYGSGRNWGTVARRVVDARPEWGALLVDLRLHGGSRGFPGPHTLAAAAGDVDALVEHLDFHAAAVVGHSFGGKVALMYAGHHGGELRQVWVMDSTLEVREPSGTAWRMIETVRALPDEFASRAEAVEGLERAGYPTGLAQWFAMNLEPRDGVYRWRLDIDGVEEMLRDFFRTDLWGVVEGPPPGVEIHVVKATESDSLDDAAEARVEAAGRANGRVLLHRLEGGHWINTDNPDAVVELLVDGLP
ncbi:MAG TPA: alpha/beta hydrolase [Longimicrobiaceae bacterium]|nr:alpha/beta hydrolase [Longimicrobiaceae bacterium]